MFVAGFHFRSLWIVWAGAPTLSAILLATMMAQTYIDDEVREKARQKLGSIFGRKVLENLSEEQAA